MPNLITATSTIRLPARGSVLHVIAIHIFPVPLDTRVGQFSNVAGLVCCTSLILCNPTGPAFVSCPAIADQLSTTGWCFPMFSCDGGLMELRALCIQCSYTTLIYLRKRGLSSVTCWCILCCLMICYIPQYFRTKPCFELLQFALLKLLHYTVCTIQHIPYQFQKPLPKLLLQNICRNVF